MPLVFEYRLPVSFSPQRCISLVISIVCEAANEALIGRRRDCKEMIKTDKVEGGSCPQRTGDLTFP